MRVPVREWTWGPAQASAGATWASGRPGRPRPRRTAPRRATKDAGHARGPRPPSRSRSLALFQTPHAPRTSVLQFAQQAAHHHAGQALIVYQQDVDVPWGQALGRRAGGAGGGGAGAGPSAGRRTGAGHWGVVARDTHTQAGCEVWVGVCGRTCAQAGDRAAGRTTRPRPPPGGARREAREKENGHFRPCTPALSVSLIPRLDPQQI